ncbi:MAG: hypothetical protein B7Y45_07810 [Sphingomonas sp. 28-66-16]|nr:MAG: hypothetical protein B7Y45_07810 [Sphingomonas sp. 28-66-16]
MSSFADGDGLGSVTLTPDDRTAAVVAIKAALRIASADDDPLIAALAETALGLAEQFLGAALIARDAVLVLPAVAGWQRLAASPVAAIVSVAGLALDGTPTVLPVVAYDIDIDARGDGWVRIGDAGGAARVAVTCRIGLASGWAALPAPIRQGAVMLAGYLYSERDTTRPPPGAITALWRPYRGLALARAGHA